MTNRYKLLDLPLLNVDPDWRASIDLYRLLDRDPIGVVPDTSYISGRRILVTGAGGSIGSALCRYISGLHPKELIMVDRDESALHAIQLTITGKALLDDDSTVLCDIRDRLWIRQIMISRRPDVVFHAAALKHQPLLEQYPGEAYKTNVAGTLNVVRAAMDARVGTLVNISTDKAASPTCVLGSSKRVAERLIAWCAPRRYMSVRFGNVINSRGSVLETFTRQLEMDRPLTITDPKISRYFMTSDEAVSLVLHAGSIGLPGESLVLDMGEPVKIVDLAARMIAEKGKGSIVYTGIRTSEKLSEDLLGNGEKDKRPNHPMIIQVPVPALSPSSLAAVRGSNSADKRVAEQLLILCDW